MSVAAKNQTPTLLFDEIDANVGGTTAAKIGEKLKQLSDHRQVVCITHFPQTASKADTHFAVTKEEREERTITSIERLSPQEREKGLLRMVGSEEKQPPMLSPLQ